MQEGKMSMIKLLSAAALLAVLCTPAIAAENTSGFARPFAATCAHAASASSRIGYTHHRRPRQNFPRKRRKHLIF
jgi:hypothetical protein